MLIRALIAVLIAGPAMAQIETAHQLHTNGIDSFAFDPPYLHSLRIDEPESAATLPGFATRPPHNHLTLVDRGALQTVINSPDPGFIGLQTGQVETGLTLSGGLAVDHLLKDLSGNGAPEAVIWQPGSATLHIAAGQASPGAFDNAARRLDLDQRVIDVATTDGELPIVAVLGSRALRVLTPFQPRPGTAVERIDLSVRIAVRDGQVAMLEHRRGALIVVAAQTGTSVEVTLFALTLGLQPSLTERARFVVEDIADLRIADLAMARIGEDDAPHAVLLANASSFGSTGVALLDLGRGDGPITIAANRQTPAPFSASAGVDCGDSDTFGHVIEGVGLRVADIASSSGRSGPDGSPEIVVAGNFSPEKCNIRRPFVFVFGIRQVLIPTGTALTLSDMATVRVWSLPNGTFDRMPDIIDLAIVQANSDELPDVALVDRPNDALILLRQQPPPCVTFITAITHGHQGTNSMRAAPSNISPLDSGFDFVPPVDYNDEYNEMLTARVDGINTARRTPEPGANAPELCPVAHIAINGHWEQATAPGAFLQLVGRLGWMASMLVPSPTCQPLPGFSKLEPVTYWLSAFWLLVPQPPIHPQPECIGPPPNYGTRAQFLFAGIGALAEYGGVYLASASSRSAASDLAGVMDRAVDEARSAMDTCSGQVLFDALGFSRGAGVTSNAMRTVSMRPLRYNADASITYLDAIDPSWGPPPAPHPVATWFNGDRIRPWARSGYVVGDPMARSAGTARTSSVFAGRPDAVVSAFIGLLAPIEALFNPLPAFLSGINVHRDVIGLPSGYDRTGVLTPNGGWFSTAPMFTHNGARDLMFSSGTPPEAVPVGYFSLSGPPPSFANATHIGSFLLDPRQAAPDLTGWQRDVAAVTDDAPFLPAECPGSTAGDGDGDRDGDLSDNASDPDETEMVADGEFDIAHGLVVNSRELLDLLDGLPREAKEHSLANLMPDPDGARVEPFLRAAAEGGLPPGGGFAGWSAPPGCTNCPVLASDGAESRLAGIAARVGEAFAGMDSAEALEPAWGAAIAPGGTPDADRIHYLAQVAAGTNRPDDAQLVFRAEPSSIEQALNPVSRRQNRLFVRVGVIPTAAESKLTVQLSGLGLAGEAAMDTGAVGALQEVSFEASRTAPSGAGAPLDLLSLIGQNVAVSWVSVRIEKLFVDEASGTAYEIIAAPSGLDWETARAIAERRRFDGQPGELADFSLMDPDRQAELLLRLNLRNPVWLGASGKTGATDSMRWLSGSQVEGQAIDPALENAADTATFLLAQPDGSLFSSGRRATVQGNPVTALVAYRQ